jgi:hypothetical protein
MTSRLMRLQASAAKRIFCPALVTCVAIIGLCVAEASEAATIRVPADASTIQQGINAAANGDTVLVAPGTYYERINFFGKAITVTSELGPDVTVIDGGGSGTVVTFMSREGRDAVLSGFTIKGGSDLYRAGGIQIGSSSPTIRGNTITGNRGCSGTGIQSVSSAPRIERNRVIGNRVELCTGAWGIGIYILGTASGVAAEIVDNDVSDNTSIGSTFGGGIALYGAGAAVLRGNVISRNMTAGPSGCGWGGGLASTNYTQATLVDNLIVGNTACFGGGVNWGGINGTNIWANNTIADNDALYHPGVAVSGYSHNEFYNNVITAASGPALFCEYTQPLLLSANDIYSAGGPAYDGICPDQTGVNGNISAPPAFIDPVHGNYRLATTSLAIDAGNDTAPQLPETDLDGAQRVFDGDGDGTPHVDMGAFELHNHPPAVSAGPDQIFTLAGDCVANVTLAAIASDPDGDALTLTWTGPFGPMIGATIVLALPAGDYTFTVTADDGNGGVAIDMVVVRVLDTIAPVVHTASATPSVLSPANHNMVPVTVTVDASDECGAAVRCRITAVTSNEAVEGLGDGDTSPDWEITGDLTLNLRAERGGAGTGRVYTITVACTDPSGNETTATVTVTVPRNN